MKICGFLCFGIFFQTRAFVFGVTQQIAEVRDKLFFFLFCQHPPSFRGGGVSFGEARGLAFPLEEEDDCGPGWRGGEGRAVWHFRTEHEFFLC